MVVQTYYGFDPSALEDSLDRTAAAAMVRTYGQAPRQLLRAPHPHAHSDLLHQPPAQVPPTHHTPIYQDIRLIKPVYAISLVFIEQVNREYV